MVGSDIVGIGQMSFLVSFICSAGVVPLVSRGKNENYGVLNSSQQGE